MAFFGSRLVGIVEELETRAKKEKRQTTKQRAGALSHIDGEDEVHVDMTQANDEEADEEGEEEESEEKDRPEVGLRGASEVHCLDQQLHLSVVMLRLNCRSTTLYRG